MGVWSLVVNLSLIPTGLLSNDNTIRSSNVLINHYQNKDNDNICYTLDSVHHPNNLSNSLKPKCKFSIKVSISNKTNPSKQVEYKIEGNNVTLTTNNNNNPGISNVSDGSAYPSNQVSGYGINTNPYPYPSSGYVDLSSTWKDRLIDIGLSALDLDNPVDIKQRIDIIPGYDQIKVFLPLLDKKDLQIIKSEIQKDRKVLQELNDASRNHKSLADKFNQYGVNMKNIDDKFSKYDPEGYKSWVNGSINLISYNLPPEAYLNSINAFSSISDVLALTPDNYDQTQKGVYSSVATVSFGLFLSMVYALKKVSGMSALALGRKKLYFIGLIGLGLLLTSGMGSYMVFNLVKLM